MEIIVSRSFFFPLKKFDSNSLWGKSATGARDDVRNPSLLPLTKPDRLRETFPEYFRFAWLAKKLPVEVPFSQYNNRSPDESRIIHILGPCPSGTDLFLLHSADSSSIGFRRRSTQHVRLPYVNLYKIPRQRSWPSPFPTHRTRQKKTTLSLLLPVLHVCKSICM